MELPPLLDWSIRAISFFNTIALLWLGCTVLLNAERKSLGLVAGGGLVLGGLFFAAHSAFVGRTVATFDAQSELWSRVGWLAFISPPYLWYVVMAWYAGVVRSPGHTLALIGLGLLGVAAPAFRLVPLPLPIPAFYAIYSGVCVGLALLALYRPAASQRFMGELARLRARPWLAVTSLVLFAASLAAAAGAAFAVESVGHAQPFSSAPPTFKQLDLLVSALLAASTVLMGRAIVSYEIFTGKTLPRGGLHRAWRNSLILGSGFGALAAWSLGVHTDPVYHLLLATGLMTLLYALLSWRSYAEHEEGMDRLRPFVASERLYERLMEDGASPGGDAQRPFRALCEDVLGARVAYLAALGPMAPLAGPPLVHAHDPRGLEPRCPGGPELGKLAASFPSPLAMSTSLDPVRFAGAVLAVPLWSERGLIGVLLLGEKVDGALYTQEEVEIARATSERLIDTQASSEMARRLMALQRQWLVESQLLDRRGRRALHDEVLPLLHTAMLLLSPDGKADTTGQRSEATELIARAHREIADLVRSMPPPLARELSRRGLIGAVRQVLDGELSGQFDSVEWRVEPEAKQRAESVPELASEVMFYAAREAIRNAARYGRNGEPGRALHLTVSVLWRDGLEVAIEDDGIGLGAASESGEGSGQGLALHSTMLAVLGGTLTAERTQDARTRVVVALPRDCLALAR